jgi:hypothetical protein
VTFTPARPTSPPPCDITPETPTGHQTTTDLMKHDFAATLSSRWPDAANLFDNPTVTPTPC